MPVLLLAAASFLLFFVIVVLLCIASTLESGSRSALIMSEAFFQNLVGKNFRYSQATTRSFVSTSTVKTRALCARSSPSPST